MLARFQTFLQSQVNHFSEKKYLLTISGGVDSVVMGHLFHQCGIAFGVAHCNFQLREEDSTLDEALVKKLALQWEVNLSLIHI